MLRRFVCLPTQRSASSMMTTSAWRWCSSTSEMGRQDATKTLSTLGEEFKGQSIDLQDICNASRNALNQVTSLSARLAKMDADEALKNKVSGVAARLKSYSMRVSTVQAEAHSLQQDMDAIVKRAYRKDSGEEAEATSSHTATTTTVEEPEVTTIDVDPPKESEVINETEIVVESTETTTSTEDVAAGLSITEITEFLHDKGIDFSDCFDAASLRQRYREVKAGTFVDKKKQARMEEMERRRRDEQEMSRNWTPPPPPPPPTYQQPPQNYGGQQQQYQQQNMNYGGSQGAGLVQDPYPGAERKMVDPMKFVWELKNEFGQQKNIDPSRVDLWCANMKLDDHRRLYEYPNLQNSPIEMRMKGDVPQQGR